MVMCRQALELLAAPQARCSGLCAACWHPGRSSNMSAGSLFPCLLVSNLRAPFSLIPSDRQELPSPWAQVPFDPSCQTDRASPPSAQVPPRGSFLHMPKLERTSSMFIAWGFAFTMTVFSQSVCASLSPCLSVRSSRAGSLSASPSDVWLSA